MCEGEGWAESEDRRRSSAASPAVLRIRNSRRPGTCAPRYGLRLFEDGLQNREDNKGKKTPTGQGATNGTPTCATHACLYDVQERVPMGHVDYFLSAPFSSSLSPQPAFSATERTFAPLFTPSHRANSRCPAHFSYLNY